MTDYKAFISDLTREAEIDFLSLPFIISGVEHELKLDENQRIRGDVLLVVRDLMSRGIDPGDYYHAEASFRFWHGTVDERLERIRSEWMATSKKPNLLDPICWLALRPPNLPADAFWIMGKWVVP